jgi:hypothetical protein
MPYIPTQGIYFQHQLKGMTMGHIYSESRDFRLSDGWDGND